MRALRSGRRYRAGAGGARGAGAGAGPSGGVDRDGTAARRGGVRVPGPRQPVAWDGPCAACGVRGVRGCDRGLRRCAVAAYRLVGARRAGRGRRRGGAAARSGRRGAACAVCDGDRAGGGVAQSRGATGCSDRAQRRRDRGGSCVRGAESSKTVRGSGSAARQADCGRLRSVAACSRLRCRRQRCDRGWCRGRTG